MTYKKITHRGIFKLMLAFTLLFQPIISQIAVIAVSEEEGVEAELDSMMEIDDEVDEEFVIDKESESNDDYDIIEEIEIEKEDIDEISDQAILIEGYILYDSDGIAHRVGARNAQTAIVRQRPNRISNTEYDFSHLLAGFWNPRENMAFLEASLDGGRTWITAFCVDPGVPYPDNDVMNNGNPLSATQRRTVDLILMYGYNNFYGFTANQRTSNDAYVVTQVAIWENLIPTNRVGYWNLNSSWNGTGVGDIYTRLIHPYDGRTLTTNRWLARGNSTRVAMYNQLRSDIRDHFIVPSFTRISHANSPTHILTFNSSNNRYQITLNDTNRVLERYLSSTAVQRSGDFSFQRNGNNLTIWSNHLNATAYTFPNNTLRKAGSGGATMYWVHPNLQNVATGGLGDPINAFMGINLARSVRVEHVIEGTNHVFHTETLAPNDFSLEYFLDGTAVSTEPISNPTYQYNGRPIRPNGGKQTITVGGHENVIRHYYTPAHLVTIEHRYQNDTGILVADTKTLIHHGNNSFSTFPYTNLYHPENNRFLRPLYNVDNPYQVFRDTKIIHLYESERLVIANHVNLNDRQEILSTNYVQSPQEHWFDGDRINGASKPRVMTALVGDELRLWRYEADETIGNDAVVNGDMMVIHHYSKPVLLTVEHVNKETGLIILTETDNTKYEKDEVKVCPRNDLLTEGVESGYAVVPAEESEACVVLELEEGDNKVRFYYDTPSLQVNVDRVEITTGAKEMETNLELSYSVEQQEHLNQDIEYRVVMRNKISNSYIYLEWHNWKEFTRTEKTVIPTDLMGKGSKADIEVTIEFRNNSANRPNRLETLTNNLTTWGYRSSERTLTIADISNKRVEYSGVARTIAVRHGTSFNVEELIESLSFNFDTEVRQRTGYAIETDFEPIYVSEIGDLIGLDGSTDLKLDLVVPNELVDSYINEQFDQKSLTHTRIELDMLFRELSGREEKRTKLEFSHPKVWVQSGKGQLFTNEQKNQNHPSIQEALHDGGRRFYIPIWQELGLYELKYQSQEPIGRNLINIDMSQNLEVFAYMYAWIDSPTLDQDMLLLTPVFLDRQTPYGWTQEEIDWLRR